MPEEFVWNGFFDPEEVLRTLGLDASSGNVVDFACGYGTFAIAAARMVPGTVHAIDIDPEMIAATRRKANAAGLTNVTTWLRDLIADGSGLGTGGAGFAMLFNILHAERPHALLEEAHRVLLPGGTLAILHWKHDPTTPRGPSLEIRPRPEQCLAWAEETGFRLLDPGIVVLPPYHYGMTLERTPVDSDVEGRPRVLPKATSAREPRRLAPEFGTQR